MKPAVVKWQLVTPDADAASKFYAALFGWSVHQDNPLGYRELRSGSERGVDGGVWPAPPGAPSFVQLFVEVADVDATIEAAVRHGAEVIVPRSALPDGQVMAVLRDPAGVTFGLTSAAQ